MSRVTSNCSLSLGSLHLQAVAPELEKERGQGYLNVIKHLRTGQLRLELRGAQYSEVCLSQLLSPQVQATFSKSGATAWRWRDPRLREQFELTLDTELDWDRFKAAMLRLV